jgi:hypothetical protein
VLSFIVVLVGTVDRYIPLLLRYDVVVVVDVAATGVVVVIWCECSCVDGSGDRCGVKVYLFVSRFHGGGDAFGGCGNDDDDDDDDDVIVVAGGL